MKLATVVLSCVLTAGTANSASAHKQAIDLFDFDQQSGYLPWSGVVTDSHGTIFGTNSGGGDGSCDGGAGCGTIYALKPPAKGSQSWTLDVLYDFQNQGDAGFQKRP